MRFILLLCFSLVCASSYAGLAGHVILAKGEVVAVSASGEIRPLQRRSEIFAGDTLRTGDDGNAQIRFIDKALLTLKPDSELSINAYQFAANDNQQGEKAVMNLVKGGFRTITGSIGKGDKSAYKVSTPAASIGIRGTNYEVQQESDNSFVMAVYSGGIKVENASGSLDLGLGAAFNYSRVTPGLAPRGLLTQPSSLSTPPRRKKTSSTDDKNAAGSASDEGDENTDSTDDNTDGNTDNSGADTADENADSGTTSPADNETMADAQSASGAAISSVSELINTNLPDKEQALEQAVDSAIDENPTPDPDPIPDPTPDPVVLFDFANPNTGITQVSSPDSRLSDAEYSLLESNKLAMVAIPVSAQYEAALFSPMSVTAFDDPNRLGYHFASQGTEVYLNDLSASPTLVAGSLSMDVTVAGITETLTISLPASADNSILYNSIESALLSSSSLQSLLYLNTDSNGRVFLVPYNNLENIQLNIASSTFGDNLGLQNMTYSPLGTVELDIRFRLFGDSGDQTISLNFDTSSSVNTNIVEGGITSLADFVTYANELLAAQNAPFEFAIDPNDTTRLTLYGTQGGAYVSMLEIADIRLGNYSINSGTAPADTQLLMNELTLLLGNMAPGLHYDVDKSEVVVGRGTLDINGKPVYFNDNQECHDNTTAAGLFICSEVARRATEPVAVVSTFSEFANCIATQSPCDIKVDNVDNRSNVSWGAWVLGPGEAIEITEADGSTVLNPRYENNINAVYWIVAEPADIATLSGTASFSASANCTDFSQCMGISNDGLVKTVNGSFNVDFTSGAISNGLLSVATTADASTVNNTWNVNFAGIVNGAAFQASSINGSITGADACSANCVTGDIGGLFVKPGDAAVGGFQLQNNTDPTVHTSGVFILQQN